MLKKSRPGLVHIVVEIVLLSVIFMLLTGGSSAVNGQAQPGSLLREIHDKGQLLVGFALAEPIQFKDPATGEWKGIAVDMMSDWAKVLGVKFVPVDTSWDAMIPGLLAKKYDFASSLNRRPQRALVVTYSDSFITDRAVFAVDARKSKAHTWADLNNSSTTICAVLSTAEDSALQTVNPAAKITRLPDENECRLALQGGRVQAFFDDVNGQSQWAEKADWVRLIVPEPPILLQGAGFAIRKGYSYDDIQALDIEVQHWLNEGLMTQANAKYNVVDWAPFTRR